MGRMVNMVHDMMVKRMANHGPRPDAKFMLENYRNSTGELPELYRRITGTLLENCRNSTGELPELYWKLNSACLGLPPL